MPIDANVLPTAEEAIEFFNLKPDSENDPMLVYSNGASLAICVLAGFGPGQIGRAVSRLLPKLAEDHGAAKWVVLCSEAYMRSYEKDEARPSHRPGELQERAESGDPTIIEVVIANGFSKDAEFSATQRFERKDGEIVWGELKVMVSDDEHQVAGAIPDAIRPIFA